MSQIDKEKLFEYKENKGKNRMTLYVHKDGNKRQVTLIDSNKVNWGDVTLDKKQSITLANEIIKSYETE
nr:hypothetical protein [Clostridioides sp.]